MSSTYSWANALTVVGPFIKTIPTTVTDVQICDQINSQIWLKYAWRWAQATLTSASGVLTLVDGVQDYAVGTTSGGGYYKLLHARITRSDVSPVQTKEFTTIANYLAPNLSQQADPLSIDAISFESSTQGFRLAQTPSVTGNATYRIDGEYHCQPLKITSTATVMSFPDQYFEVVTEGIKAKYYQLGDDPRAVTQMLVFERKLHEMAAAEDFSGEDNRFPDGGLGIGSNVNIGVSWY